MFRAAGPGRYGRRGILPLRAAPDTLRGMAAEFTPEYVEALRRLTGEQKLRAAFALYWSARELKAAALRAQHPDWTPEEVQRRVKEIFLHAVT